jgi:hypothetical protein
MSYSILDDLFQGCALTAFLQQSHAQQDWPDVDATRRLANRLYEAALAATDAGQPGSDAACQGLTLPLKRASIGS